MPPPRDSKLASNVCTRCVLLIMARRDRHARRHAGTRHRAVTVRESCEAPGVKPELVPRDRNTLIAWTAAVQCLCGHLPSEHRRPATARGPGDCDSRSPGGGWRISVRISGTEHGISGLCPKTRAARDREDRGPAGSSGRRIVTLGGRATSGRQPGPGGRWCSPSSCIPTWSASGKNEPVAGTGS